MRIDDGVQLEPPKYDSEEAAQVAGLLIAAGLNATPHDPLMQKGVGPDLFVTEPLALWVEVKAVAPEGYLRAYDLAHEYAIHRYSKNNVQHAVDMYVDGEANHGDYKFLLGLLDSANDTPDAFVALAKGYAKENVAQRCSASYL